MASINTQKTALTTHKLIGQIRLNIKMRYAKMYLMKMEYEK
jgi:hypothetical protein